jgi:hypothetical protein
LNSDLAFVGDGCEFDGGGGVVVDDGVALEDDASAAADGAVDRRLRQWSSLGLWLSPIL